MAIGEEVRRGRFWRFDEAEGETGGLEWKNECRVSRRRLPAPIPEVFKLAHEWTLRVPDVTRRFPGEERSRGEAAALRVSLTSVGQILARLS
jgi:hypothetical protein